jgi:hypothetical protein
MRRSVMQSAGLGVSVFPLDGWQVVVKECNRRWLYQAIQREDRRMCLYAATETAGEPPAVDQLNLERGEERLGARRSMGRTGRAWTRRPLRPVVRDGEQESAGHSSST